MPEWSVPGYTELRMLGSGGFGEVVLARHDISGIQVAIKYLRRGVLDDPAFAEMFRAEARVLASLQNPNVVRLYEYIETPAGAAIVMELVDGVSLREIVSRYGRTSAELALVVLQGSLLGLAAAHAQGVVHRDYKPENVLVDGAGVSKLTDFGIAARTGERALPAGTLAYAPPEQLAGGPATPATDVYAATATFYECLAGRPPFTGDTAEALMQQHRSDPVPMDPVPVPLRPVVAAGMAKDPSARPPDAASFVAWLSAAAAGAYGADWESRGRSHLAEAALLLAALWPSGGAPAVAGQAVEHIGMSGSGQPSQNLQPSHGVQPPQQPSQAGQPSQVSPQSEHVRHVEHLRHLAHLRHLSRLQMGLVIGGAVVVVGAGAAIGASLAGGSAPACTAPQIASVSAFQATATQTVQITGNCFGTGNTSSAVDTAYFRISDLTKGWNACWTLDPDTDSVTCDISSWTAQGITFSGYTGDYGAYTVDAGDQIKVQVWNPQSGKGPATCQVVAGSGANNDCSGT
jgi:serine/threonine protein kinase